MKACAVEACENGPLVGRGFCNKHYHKLKKYGDPLAGYEEKNKKGEGSKRGDGYLVMHSGGKKVYGHVLIIEKALGHPIPAGAPTHHVDEYPSNNVNSNLVLCDSNAYHHFVHMRTRALKECGHASWRRCTFCGKYDDPENMYIYLKLAYHRSCSSKYNKERYHEKTTPITRTR